MYMPPLFPTLLRTTGAGFCYNIGRIAAAAGTVIFGMFSSVSDHRVALWRQPSCSSPPRSSQFSYPNRRMREARG